MKTILMLSVLSLCTYELNALQGSFDQGSQTQGQYSQNPSDTSYNRYNSSRDDRYNSSRNDRYDTSSDSYNQPQSYYNRSSSEDRNQSYYRQEDNRGNTSSTNPDTLRQNDTRTSNQPQAYHSWGHNYTNRPIGQATDTPKTDYRTSDSKFPQDQAGTDADREINRKIRSKITGWFTDNYKNIALDTSNGVVTLNGFVKSDDQNAKLINEIRNINGVKSINDHIQIKQQPQR